VSPTYLEALRTLESSPLLQLVLLHLLSPLALSAVQHDREALKRSVLLSTALRRVKAKPAQRVVPANRAADGVHRQRASEEPRSVRVRFGRRLGWVIERRRPNLGVWRRRRWAEDERRRGVEERHCGL